MRLDGAKKITGRSKQTIYRWVREGKVRSLKTGKAMWFNVADLREARETPSGRPPKKVDTVVR